MTTIDKDGQLEMCKKMLSCRVAPEIIDMRDKLIEHFSDGVAKANSETVVSLAIRELYENYIGEYKSSTNK